MSADESSSESTGLPGIHSWTAVYLLVLGSFVLWVILLLALERFFS